LRSPIPRIFEPTGKTLPDTHSPKIAVAASRIGGMGVFALAPIMKGDVVHDMGGEVITLATCIARIALGRLNIDDPLPVGNYTFLQLDRFSNRFNHACEPNAGLRRASQMIALTSIAAGQEITFDYSTTMRRNFYSRWWSMPCNCGAATCRRKIGDVRTIPHERLSAYIKAGSLQDFIVASLGQEALAAQAAASRPS
jgi:uncharacterized protein